MKILYYVLLLFLCLNISEASAHQDFILSFENKKSQVHILTGFDFYVEIDKSEILNDIVSDLIKDNNYSGTIIINYVHHYISKIAPSIYLSVDKLDIKNEYGKVFSHVNNKANTTYINVIAEQLPIKEISRLVYSIVKNGSLGELTTLNHKREVEYGHYEILSIDPNIIKEQINKISLEEVINILHGAEYESSKYKKIDTDKFGFYICDLDIIVYRNTKNRLEEVYSTDSLYQIYENGLSGNLYVFESRCTARFIEKSGIKSRMIHPKLHFPYCRDNYQEFKVIDLSRKRHVISYNSFGNDDSDFFQGNQVLYDIDSKRIIYNFDNIIDSLLRQ